MDGSVFDGNFESDKKMGYGTMIYANLDKYVGEF